ncbi:hypothetical protein AB0K15_39180 [Amycolatopsis sp. NPDC049253]
MRRRRLAEDVLTVELNAGSRIVFADEQVVAFSPFASAADFEV